MKRLRLGDMLISMGLLSEEQLNEALGLQKERHMRLGELLIADGYITEAQLINALKDQLGIDFIDLTKVEIDPEMSKYIPKALAKDTNIVPVRVVKDSLFLAMSDPLNFYAIEQAKDTSRKRIVPMFATQSAVTRAINILYENMSANEAMAQMRAEAGIVEEVVEATDTEEAAEEGPSIRLVNSIFERAYMENASDIHIEPTETDMIIRLRVDGILHKVMTIPVDIKDSVVSRIKVMCRMDIVERRIPQDGRIAMKLQGKDVEMRVNTIPTIYGEKVCIRLLGRSEKMLTRQGIGMIFDSDNQKVDKLLANTSGVIMIVGPTGSGKTSTMFTIIKEMLSEGTNLITLEDPVEFNIPGATQVQINEKVGLTFASGLRAILRQDPDIICVGEIRDGETAQIAMRAAITGHLVITTIHTEDATTAVDRLKDMGVEPYLVAAGLRGVISQRLLRRICPDCKTEYTPDQKLLDLSTLSQPEERVYYHGAGCEKCFGSGYKGRIGAFEILTMNEKLRSAIIKGVDSTEFRQVCRESANYVPMIENADRLVGEGVTTVEEVIRTVLVTD